MITHNPHVTSKIEMGIKSHSTRISVFDLLFQLTYRSKFCNKGPSNTTTLGSNFGKEYIKDQSIRRGTKCQSIFAVSSAHAFRYCLTCDIKLIFHMLNFVFCDFALTLHFPNFLVFKDKVNKKAFHVRC